MVSTRGEDRRPVRWVRLASEEQQFLAAECTHECAYSMRLAETVPVRTKSTPVSAQLGQQWPEQATGDALRHQLGGGRQNGDLAVGEAGLGTNELDATPNAGYGVSSLPAPIEAALLEVPVRKAGTGSGVSKALTTRQRFSFLSVRCVTLRHTAL